MANVVWCTGFRTDFGWIDLPVFDEDGQPRHDRGVVESERASAFSGSSSSIRSRPTCCPIAAETRGISLSTSAADARRLRRPSTRSQPHRLAACGRTGYAV